MNITIKNVTQSCDKGQLIVSMISIMFLLKLVSEITELRANNVLFFVNFLGWILTGMMTVFPMALF